MTTRAALMVTGLLTLSAATAGATANGHGTDSFWRKVLAFVGIDANPTNLRAPAEAPEGTVWVIDIERHTQRVVTKTADFRSPVFEPGDRTLLALRRDDVVRIPLSGGEPVKLFTTGGVVKIVGLSRSQRDEALILTREPGHGHLAVEVLSLSSGRRTRLEYDRESDDDQRLVNHLAGWDRTYDGDLLIVRSARKETPLGEEELAGVVLRRGDRGPANLTPDDTVDCLQPSLSWDRHRVAFIKRNM